MVRLFYKMREQRRSKATITLGEMGMTKERKGGREGKGERGKEEEREGEVGKG